MAEENYGFAQTRARLDDIVAQVRKKDVSLEKSLDLLEEGVRLANQCTELIDHADWEAGEVSGVTGSGDPVEASDPGVAVDAGEATSGDTAGHADSEGASEDGPASREESAG